MVSGAQPASAQNAASAIDRRVQDAIDKEKALADPRPPECRAKSRLPGEIIVCGGRDAREKERLPLRGETESALSINDGLPRAPNVSGLRDCARGCIGFGKVPAPMYMLDVTKLPQAPAGSDADRIAKGEVRSP
jgi:hypothetical protein